ncbi:MAG TPA: HPr family phosphocarrier protein [Planctomycetota bacterium]|nr:HPr family phosphocarrier protein [Planctomycetota bacterium]
MEARRTVRIVNASGLHARPCHALVSTALRYQSELRVASGGREVNGKSILELMTLNAGPETLLEFSARGGDAQALVDELAALVEAGFSESG